VGVTSIRTSEDPTPPSIRDLWTMALWTGLAGGLIEVGIAAARRQWYLPPYIVSPQLVWMIPVDAVAFAALLAFGLSIVAQWKGVWRHVRAWHALFAFGMLSAAGPLLAIPRLHWAAVLVAAAGSATQLSRRFGTNPRTLARQVPWLLGAVVLLTVVVNGTLMFRERRQLSALPAAPANAPNVVLVVLDTVRTESLSLYGYQKPTSPELEKIAASGVVFRSAISTAPWTLPSHSSMFTGRLPNEMSGGWRTPLDGTFPTLAETLRSAGYATGGFVANVGYVSAGHGLNRGFIHYEDLPNSAGATLVASSLGALVGTEDHVRELIRYHRVLPRKTATQVTDELLAWVKGHEGRRPFFAFANFMDGHEPYLPPEPFASRFGPPHSYEHLIHDPTDATRPGKVDTPKAVIEEDRRAYESGIAYMDHELGRMVAGLREDGLLDNTLFIVVADHGEQFGEHRLFGHGNSLYMPLVHVPLVLSFPSRVPPGRRVETPVTLRDLPATVMDLAGLRGRGVFPGVSLAPCWQGGVDAPCSEPALISQASVRTFGLVRPWYPLSHGDMQSVVADGFHYIWNSNGSQELYELAVDPAEAHDLIDTDAGRVVANRLKALLPLP